MSAAFIPCRLCPSSAACAWLDCCKWGINARDRAAAQDPPPKPTAPSGPGDR